MSELIREHTLLFSRENYNLPEATLSSIHPIHRQSNLVEWVHDEPPTQPLLTENPTPNQTLACPRTLSLSLKTERKGSHQSPCDKNVTHHLSDHQFTEGSSCASSALIYDNYNCQHSPALEFLQTRPPPSSPPACTNKAPEAAIDSCVQSRSWPDMEEPIWGPDRALGDSGGNSEAQDSTLSVYDNMGVEGQGEGYTEEKKSSGIVEAKGGTASIADSSSSWSSCEIVPLDGDSEGGGAASPCNNSPGHVASFRMDFGEIGPRANSPASSSVPTDAPLSTGSSEVFLPNAPLEPLGIPASHAMQCLVAGIRQQMARQKAEYEAKLNR